MKTSFGIKLGLLLMLLITSLVGGMLLYFNNYSTAMLQSDLKQTISDVTRTGAMVFHSEDREVIESLRTQLYQQLPDDYLDQVKDFVGQKRNVNTELLALDDREDLQRGDEFQYIVQLLRRIQEGSRDRLEALRFLPQTNVTDDNASRVAWAYLMVPIPSVATKDAIVFLADSNYDIDNVFPENPIGNMYEGEEFFSAPFTGKLGISDGWYEDQFGRVMTAVVPIKNSKGEVIASLGVDYNVNMFTKRVDEQLTTSWIVFAIAILLVFVISALITIWVSVPLAKLRSGAEQLSQQDFDHIIRIRSKDEFGLLAKTMNLVSKRLGEFTRSLDDIVQQRTEELSKTKEEVLQLNQKLKEENAHLGAEVDSLIALRQRMMPEINSHRTMAGYQVEFYYLPSQTVSGDFWQVMTEGVQASELVVGQVSGYGLETATTTMQVQSLFACNKGQQSFDDVNSFLYQLANSINLKLFCKALNINLTETQLKLTGHLEEPILFAPNSEPEFVLVNDKNLPLGLQPEVKTESVEVTLAQGQSLLIYSSGLVKALIKLIGENTTLADATQLSAEQIIDISGLRQQSPQQLVTKLQSQPWFAEFEDDVCFITIRKEVSDE